MPGSRAGEPWVRKRDARRGHGERRAFEEPEHAAPRVGHKAGGRVSWAGWGVGRVSGTEGMKHLRGRRSWVA